MPESRHFPEAALGRSRTDETIENEGHRERPGDVSSRPERDDLFTMRATSGGMPACSGAISDQSP